MSPEYWKVLLDYRPDTGLLFWCVDRGTRIKCGTMAGYLAANGYIQIGHNRKTYRAHRIAWMLHYAEDPGHLLVDHVDRNRANNKINNLRLVTPTGNSINATTRLPNTVTGYKGVHRTKYGTYYAQISINGINRHLGCFNDLSLAIEARKQAEALHHNPHAANLISLSPQSLSAETGLG
jgi:hypothetical protein